MAETDTTTEAADPGQHDGSTDQRLTGLENAVERIEQAIGRLVPGSHAEAQQREEKRLDRPSDIQEQAIAAARQVAAERDRETAAQSAADADRAERESTRERLAKLEERPPAPARARWTKLVTGWGDGRA